eukprot:CAMPEP_0205999202 /NCGR_PEP_ID=MMETSP1464-20131121/699_1 /ASSEMBLY_ACC=CAM_ASM_001124 /TAXON_ID=119497 /ORGANISM="Exanthemachrysis gayraliae, Strain RCC1523" /LENGTH=275 /DNA_ID=CAMNT_0053372385 /DNA_START=206 /DNA_END=1034 /DNA_ORIENTATION=+
MAMMSIVVSESFAMRLLRLGQRRAGLAVAVPQPAIAVTRLVLYAVRHELSDGTRPITECCQKIACVDGASRAVVLEGEELLVDILAGRDAVAQPAVRGQAEGGGDACAGAREEEHLLHAVVVEEVVERPDLPVRQWVAVRVRDVAEDVALRGRDLRLDLLPQLLAQVHAGAQGGVRLSEGGHDGVLDHVHVLGPGAPREGLGLGVGEVVVRVGGVERGYQVHQLLARLVVREVPDGRVWGGRAALVERVGPRQRALRVLLLQAAEEPLVVRGHLA